MRRARFWSLWVARSRATHSATVERVTVQRSGRIVSSPALLAVVLLCACAGPDDRAERPRPSAGNPSPSPTFVVPAALPAGRVLLVDRYRNRFVVYDERAGRVVTEENDGQIFTYGMPGGGSDLVTRGSSEGGPFQMFRVSLSGAKAVGTVPDGVFPLAGPQGREILLRQSYDADGRLLKKSLARLSGSSLQSLPVDVGDVRSATTTGQRLWLTVDKGPGVGYALSSLDLSNQAAGLRDEGQLASQPDLFTLGDQVVIDGNFSRQLRGLSCALYCRVDATASRIFQLTVSDQTLRLTSWSTRTGTSRVVAQGDVIDFSVNADQVVVYTRSGTTTVKSRDLP